MFKKILMELRLVNVLVAFLIAFTCLFAIIPQGVLAATTADVTVNATPAFVGISCNVSDYDFGTVASSSTTNTTEAHFGITNTSTVQTDQTIAVTTTNWTGGIDWVHDDTATPGADTVGLLSSANGTWGVGDIIVKFASPNYIAENQTALTDYAFGLGLQAPTSYSDGVEKTNTVRVTATQG